MSKTKIPPKTVLKLWLRSGGRCEFRGCNQPLWCDTLTQQAMNRAYNAHIIADSPDGPRGDAALSGQLAQAFENLMLLCPTHHKLVDDNPEHYPVDLLHEYKREHEERIELLTSITEAVKTHLVVFRDNIGDRTPSISIDDAYMAVLPRYPAEAKFIEMDLTNHSFRDHEFVSFAMKQIEIRRLIECRIRQRAHVDRINHLSVFALASIPLLIYFGYELGDVIPSDVYQPRRDSNNPWKWQVFSDAKFNYTVATPSFADKCHDKIVVLNLSLSDTIHPQAIAQVLEEPYCTYKMVVPEPGRNYLTSKEQLELFKVEMRTLLGRIKKAHHTGYKIHLFPAVPASVAVSLGQLLLPKSDPAIHIYDYNSRCEGFQYALSLP